MKKLLLLLLLLLPLSLFAQTATINWTNIHQVIDGFGGIDRDDLTFAQQNFVFGTGGGQLGISILHTNVQDGSSGSCTSIGTGCQTVTSNMSAVIANGGRVGKARTGRIADRGGRRRRGGSPELAWQARRPGEICASPA